MLKSHKAIVGSRFFYLTYFFLPAVFTVIGIIYRIFFELEANFFLIIQYFAMVYEASTEYFGYGPVYRKNNLGMEYLKTSANGMRIFESSILTDSILRILRSAAYTLIPGIAVYKSMGDPRLIAVYALMLANVSVWSVNFTRYVTMYGFLILVILPLVAAGMLIDSLGMRLSDIRIPLVCILCILLSAGVWYTRKLAKKKIILSYSDTY